eukprot:1648860-Rhodomonas_salina.2
MHALALIPDPPVSLGAQQRRHNEANTSTEHWDGWGSAQHRSAPETRMSCVFRASCDLQADAGGRGVRDNSHQLLPRHEALPLLHVQRVHPLSRWAPAALHRSPDLVAASANQTSDTTDDVLGPSELVHEIVQGVEGQVQPARSLTERELQEPRLQVSLGLAWARACPMMMDTLRRKRSVLQNRTEQNRTDQTRPEQNRTKTKTKTALENTTNARLVCRAEEAPVSDKVTEDAVGC